ncbi:MAG: hypothetical protein SGI83_08160 [Bacteroidota bacterium]|nr:hypothetical protein [Bacteroidota bacterium]
MVKDTIVQFICYVTQLGIDEFIPKWDEYANRLQTKKQEPVLLGQLNETKNKFRYISRHEWLEKDFQFKFMNERKSVNFPEHTIKAIQAGGYSTLQKKNRNSKGNDDVKIMAFINHDENDIDFYTQLPSYHQLTIHQAYYESCLYGYVLEFIVPETEAGELLVQLKQRPGIEAGVYKECLVTQE